MIPQTIVMSTCSNREWIKSTGLKPISLVRCYLEYAGGAEKHFRFIRM